MDEIEQIANLGNNTQEIMRRNSLEEILQFVGQHNRFYNNIDMLARDSVVFYTAPAFKPSDDAHSPIDFSRPFERGSYGNIFEEFNLGNLFNDKELDTYNFVQRYDFSEHDDKDGNKTNPHLNQTVNDKTKTNNYNLYKDIITGGTSKKSEDGYKGFGPSHHINFEGFEDGV